MRVLEIKLIVYLILAATVSISPVAAEEDNKEDEDRDNRIFDAEELTEEFYSIEGEETIELDTNDNDSVDYLYKTHGSGEKRAEALDYNHDGTMDDFYYYNEGVLQRREIDSNNDGKIDIWVYLDEGVYVSKFERDENHNGEIDIEKNYEEEAEQRKMEREME